MEELTLAIMGIDHANTDKAKSSRRFELLLCLPGEPVHLVPEPRNPHDPNAIAVFGARGIQLGYLSAERAPFVGSRLKSGVETTAIFQGITRHMAWVRVRFGGGMPTLPSIAPHPVAAPARAADDFFADADGPDWGA